MITPEPNGWRTRPTYTVLQAARLAKTTSATVRRWLYGYQALKGGMRPVFGQRQRGRERPAEISFLMLAEIVVVSAFRKKKVKLARLRCAHDYATEVFKIEYPFAHLKLKTDGAHVLHAFEEDQPGQSLLALDRYGQWTLPGGVVQVLENFEFEVDWAARWFPIGRNIPIVVDPRFGAGKPTIVRRGITIETLYKRWQAGQTIAFLAGDYKLQRGIVELALQKAESLVA